jgi:hypothetical protein
VKAWLRYYLIYCALVAPFVAVSILLNHRSGIASALVLGVGIFTAMGTARKLERRIWPTDIERDETTP